MNNIIFIGPPGSGKGTQSQFISHKLSIPHLSIGDMLRKIVEDGGDYSKQLMHFMQKGQLVPSELINILIKNTLLDAKYSNGCLFDGYPRSVDQAIFLDKIINESIVFYFDLSISLITERILGRFSCLNCGKIYNNYYNVPKKNNVCDDCSSQHFSYRQDDNKDTVIKRIFEYESQTKPLIEYYRAKKDFFTIDASKSKEEVSNMLLEVLKTI